MVYFFVAMDCKSICLCQACMVYTLPFSFVLFHRCTYYGDSYRCDTDSFPQQSLVYVSENGSGSVGVWAEKPSRAKVGCVRMYGCDKILNPGAEHLSILAGEMWHWRGRVATGVQQPTILPIMLSLSLLEMGLFHSLLVVIYTFCEVPNNTGSWHRACFGTGKKQTEHLRGGNQIKVLQTEWRQQKVRTVLMLLLLCQKTVSIQRETISHSITCSMCAFQGFFHSGL